MLIVNLSIKELLMNTKIFFADLDGTLRFPVSNLAPVEDNLCCYHIYLNVCAHTCACSFYIFKARCFTLIFTL